MMTIAREQAHDNPRIRCARPGFTLMEILIAVMILGLLGAMVGPALNNIYKNQQKRATKGNLMGIKKGLDMYKNNIGQWPATLKDLIKKPREERAAKKWEGPYIGDENTKEVPEDSWGGKFYSYGPNGKGAPKDEWISVWDE